MCSGTHLVPRDQGITALGNELLGIGTSVGEGAIRRARQASGMTLKDLSELTGLSQAFLSEVENGKGNLTIGTLRRIADGLGLSLFDVLAEESPFIEVVRAKERRSIKALECNVEYELVSSLIPSAKSQVVIAYLYPGASTSDNPEPHGTGVGEEIGLVLSGTVEIQMRDSVQVLREGDSIRFNPFYPHRYIHVGGSRAALLTIMRPPSF
jgi:transcriptional regulator with XRE-family HTH domain